MIGSQLGNYKIIDKLGEGGMGIVYKAVDTSLDRVVAIKSLSAELARNPDLEKRFRAEAKAQANLNHTNIATLFAFFVQEGTAWMVMEYIEGDTVHDLIQRRGPIPAQDAIPIFKQALLGIGYAHRMGIVHRDIKPSNIMVKRDGIVKVMDFGIAKVLGNRGMTRTGTQMGTAYYMSPEQVVNKGVDIRSDVYSLGVTFYEMLTANVPFTGDTDFEVMQAHMQTAPPLPTRFYPYIPKGVENAVLRAIAKGQDQRFQTVEEFGLALEHPDDYQAPTAPAGVEGAALAGATRLESAATQTIRPATGTPVYPAAPVPTPPTGLMTAPPPPPPSPAGNKKMILIAGGCAAVVVLAGLGFVLRPKPQPSPIVSQNQVSPPTAPAAAQGQVEVPIPLPPEPQNTPAPTAGGTQQPNPNRQPQQQQQTAAPPSRQTPPPQSQDQARGVTVPQAPPPASPPAAPVPPAPVQGSAVTIPAGTKITVRTITMASTRSSKLGDAVSASVDASVMAGDRVAIPKGADVSLNIAGLDDGLSLKLASVSVGNRPYNVSADNYDYDSAGNKPKKGVLGRVGGLVHKKPREGGDATVIAPGSRLTFTLTAPMEVVAP